MSETRTQYYIDSKTGDRKEIKVKSIKAKFLETGKGGAIKGAKPAKPKPAIKALNEPKS